jgi:probable phosphoglycerate mutase
VLLRHGETQWSAQRRHTGRTDVELTPDGEAAARALRPLLGDHPFGLVLSSPLLRASRTAELALGRPVETDSDLQEWDYGAYEGRTAAEIRSQEGAHWSIWTAAAGPGALAESLEQVAHRADRVTRRVLPVLESGQDVLLVAHGHLLRVLAARWIEAAPELGQALVLGATRRGLLGWEHDHRAIVGWNLEPPS